MTTLLIKDLSMTEQLDRTQMSKVRGGRWKEEKVEVLPVEQYGPAGANVPAIWNNGVDGPIIIWNRG